MCMKMKMDSSVFGRNLSKQARYPAVFAGLYTCIRCGQISKRKKTMKNVCFCSNNFGYPCFCCTDMSFTSKHSVMCLVKVLF